MFTQRNTYTSA